MRRKDNQPKAKALRNMPKFNVGFRESQRLTAEVSECQEVSPPRYAAVSLFAGCGGLDLGFEGNFRFLGKDYPALPFHVVAAYDNLGDAVDCYALNLGQTIRNADLTKTSPETMPDADVLLGGFPCQDFSSSGPKTGFDGKRGVPRQCGWQVEAKCLRHSGDCLS